MGYLDDLKQLIYDQTHKLGSPVANIYGATQPPLSALGSTEHSVWAALTVPSRAVVDIDNFYALYSALKTGAIARLETDDGSVVSEYVGSDSVSTLLRGSVDLAQPRSITVAVQCGDDQSAFTVLLDGHAVRKDVGSGEFGMYLSTGIHTVEILAASNTLAVKVPKDLRVRADLERLPAPTWVSISSSYLDPAQGTATVVLTWAADPTAGGWRILRRQLNTISTILTVGPVNPNSEFAVKLSGDHLSEITIGQELYALAELMGIVIDKQADNSDTLLTLRLAPGIAAPNSFWEGRSADAGTFVELQRLGNTQGAGTASFTDNGVKGGEFYDYALQAWGILDNNAWSGLSEIRIVKAGDTDPPGSITFATGYPTVINRRAFVKFTTPSDIDYSGVHVYYREKFTGPVTSATGSTITNTGAAFTTLDDSWTVFISGGRGYGQRFAVLSNTATVVTISGTWITTPDNTSTYVVYKDITLYTDYGLPNTVDQLDFEPIDTAPSGPVQEYQFRAFDNAFNEQQDVYCQTWSFDPGDPAESGWTSPPIVAIRQVPVVHPTLTGQDDFAAPYNNNTNWVIIELGASDVAGRTGAIDIWYQRRGDPTPIQLPASTAPSTEGGAPAIIDTVLGTRSRYVPIARTLQDNWIKVYAIDSDGNKSSTTTFTVDYNTIPEVSAFEGRVDPTTVFSPAWNSGTNPFGSGTVNTTGIVWVSGAVDDDSCALKYWLEDPTGTDPTAAAPRVLDLTIVRSFTFVVSLGDGERKNLILEPWSGPLAPPDATPNLVTEPSTGTISLSVSGSTYVRSSGSFVSDGFTVGMVVFATGFSNAQNNGASVVTTVTTTVLTVLKVGNLVTESSGSGKVLAAGAAGSQVQREFTHSARAQANFEDKDQDGNVSGKTVKIIFEIRPVPVIQTPSTTGTTLHVHASGSTATTLKASTSPSWTVNQWSTQAPKKFFVLTNPNSSPWNPLETQVRSIVSNTADTLTVDRAWAPIPHSALFWIVDSAVMYRIDGDDTQSFFASGGIVLVGSTYAPTAGLVFFDRKTGDESTVVEYFAAKNKVPDQLTNRVTVDADTIPEIGSVTLTEVSANDLRLTVVGPDDDVKLWRSYRRKGAWPTLTGFIPTPLTAGDLDRQYLHHTATVENLTYDSYAGTGQQNIVVVPTNSMNQDGPPVTKSITIAGNLGNPRLANLRTAHADTGGVAYNRVTWDHPNISDVSTTYHVKVFASRKLASSGATDVANAELTPGGFVRIVTYDSEASDSHLNTDDSQTISGQGSWIHALPSDHNLRAAAGTGVAYTWVYSVELYDGSNSLVGTYSVEDTDYYVPPACHVLTSAVTITDFGTILTGFCQSHPTRVVTWTTDNTNAGFSISIEQSTEATPTTWTLVASNLAPSAGQWTQSDWGYGNGSTETRYWTYRVWAVRQSDGSQSGSKQTSNQVTYGIDFCDSGGQV